MSKKTELFSQFARIFLTAFEKKNFRPFKPIQSYNYENKRFINLHIDSLWKLCNINIFRVSTFKTYVSNWNTLAKNNNLQCWSNGELYWFDLENEEKIKQFLQGLIDQSIAI